MPPNPFACRYAQRPRGVQNPTGLRITGLRITGLAQAGHLHFRAAK
jgi:hypothetical protein